MAAVTKQMLQFQLSIIISKKKMRQAKADPGPVKMEGKEEGYINNLYIVICLHHDPYRGVVRLSNAFIQASYLSKVRLLIVMTVT